MKKILLMIMTALTLTTCLAAQASNPNILQSKKENFSGSGYDDLRGSVVNYGYQDFAL